MKRIGLILYKLKRRDYFNKIFIDLFINKIKKKKDTTSGFIRSINKGWEIFNLKYDLFRNYIEFDNFLLELSDKFKEDKDILIIGYNDEKGFMWGDYEK